MAKAATLDAGALARVVTPPKASTTPRAPAQAAPKVETVPVQIRVPAEVAKSIRVGAAMRDQSISDYVAMCVQDWQARNAS
jgi:hypothetical protein